MHDLVDMRRCHLFLQPLERDPRIHVVSVGMTDREVSLPVSRCYGYAYDVPVLAHPPWTKGRQVRVACLKIDGDLLVMRQVREIDRDIPCQFLGLIHLGSNDAVLLK